jgi:hypothetical protein
VGEWVCHPLVGIGGQGGGSADKEGQGGWAASWPDGFLEGLAVRKLDYCRQQIKYVGS